MALNFSIYMVTYFECILSSWIYTCYLNKRYRHIFDDMPYNDKILRIFLTIDANNSTNRVVLDDEFSQLDVSFLEFQLQFLDGSFFRFYLLPQCNQIKSLGHDTH